MRKKRLLILLVILIGLLNMAAYPTPFASEHPTRVYAENTRVLSPVLIKAETSIYESVYEHIYTSVYECWPVSGHEEVCKDFNKGKDSK